MKNLGTRSSKALCCSIFVKIKIHQNEIWQDIGLRECSCTYSFQIRPNDPGITHRLSMQLKKISSMVIYGSHALLWQNSLHEKFLARSLMNLKNKCNVLAERNKLKVQQWHSVSFQELVFPPYSSLAEDRACQLGVFERPHLIFSFQKSSKTTGCTYNKTYSQWTKNENEDLREVCSRDETVPYGMSDKNSCGKRSNSSRVLSPSRENESENALQRRDDADAATRRRPKSERGRIFVWVTRDINMSWY